MEEKWIVQFILLDENMPVQSKIPTALGQKLQVVCDHYSLENLKTTGSSAVVQLSKICPLGNGGSHVPHAFDFSTLIISMDRLPNASFMSIDFPYFSFESPRDWWNLLSERYNSTVVSSFLHFLSPSRESWRFFFPFSFQRISAFLSYQACILTQISHSFELQ